MYQNVNKTNLVTQLPTVLHLFLIQQNITYPNFFAKNGYISKN